MGIFDIHTNIPLDFPSPWTGSIYKESNIRGLFNSDAFIEKVVSGDVYGTVGFKNLKKIPASFISHTVIDAYISETKEIMFKIETMDNKPGRMLDAMLSKNPLGYLAKMIAMVDTQKSVGGTQHLVDIKYVHIDENDCFDFSDLDTKTTQN